MNYELFLTRFDDADGQPLYNATIGGQTYTATFPNLCRLLENTMGPDDRVEQWHGDTAVADYSFAEVLRAAS